MRVLPEKQTGREVVRASGKPVWTWPSVGAADAGPMQIQWREEVRLRCAETVLSGATHDTADPEDRLGRESIAKSVVEKGARKNLFGSETER